jgi:hypothetical protein
VRDGGAGATVQVGYDLGAIGADVAATVLDPGGERAYAGSSSLWFGTGTDPSEVHVRIDPDPGPPPPMVLMARAYVGYAYRGGRGGEPGDGTVPLGLGVTTAWFVGSDHALLAALRLQHHAGEESPTLGANELLFTLGYGYLATVPSLF